MKKKNRIMILLLTAILTLTSVFPMQVAAASGKTPGKVTLSSVSTSAYNTVTMKWKKTSNATNYMVYYREAGKKSWTKLATLSSTKTGYTHKASKKYPISVGKKYNYTVRGYNSKSKKYGSYNTKGLTVQTKPDTVKVSKVTVNKDSSVTVSWKAVGGADRYVIMRKTPGSSWKKLKQAVPRKKPERP